MGWFFGQAAIHHDFRCPVTHFDRLIGLQAVAASQGRHPKQVGLSRIVVNDWLPFQRGLCSGLGTRRWCIKNAILKRPPSGDQMLLRHSSLESVSSPDRIFYPLIWLWISLFPFLSLYFFISLLLHDLPFDGSGIRFSVSPKVLALFFLSCSNLLRFRILSF